MVTVVASLQEPGTSGKQTNTVAANTVQIQWGKQTNTVAVVVMPALWWTNIASEETTQHPSCHYWLITNPTCFYTCKSIVKEFNSVLLAPRGALIVMMV